ncbi:MAG: SET domain-containing protein-lysine N-methyltransferase [Burkholderiales bacterium]|nr:SET domain-containing protein-lysine N-methyltransferase [Burkholderiales bacterium]
MSRPERSRRIAPHQAGSSAAPATVRDSSRRATSTSATVPTTGKKAAGKRDGASATSKVARAVEAVKTANVGKVSQPVRTGNAAKVAPAPVPAELAAPRGKRIQIRTSGVHGKGVFALATIKKGETLVEYKGEVISWPEALRRHPHDPAQPDHTFYFHLDDGHVIDGKHGGNSSRWINHSCDPNCEAEDDNGRIFIKALRKIRPGEELFFDYQLIIDERYTAKLKARYACWCGAKTCRGTMLAPKT